MSASNEIRKHQFAKRVGAFLNIRVMIINNQQRYAIMQIDTYTQRAYNMLQKYINVCTERKRIMKQRINISLDTEIAEKLKKLAEESHRNVSQWITDKVIEVSKADEKQEDNSKK